MKSNALIVVVGVVALATGGCGASGEEPEGSESSTHATTMVNQLALEECPVDSGCPNGCVQIDYGVDDNANGALDSGEIDGTEYVCHGSDGEAGAPGANGEDGANGSDCTVSQIDCQATLSCEDGTSVSWELGGCSCDECGVCDSDDSNNCIQDCEGTWGGSATCGFIDNLDGTIAEPAKGITWMKCAQGMTFNANGNTCEGNYGTFQYCDGNNNSCNGGVSGNLLDGGGNSEAWDTCNALDFAGQTDWRVPNKEELKGLIKCTDGTIPADLNSCASGNYTSPAIDTSFFSNFPSTYFWASASYAGGSTSAWHVGFTNGHISLYNKVYTGSVLCVR